jgi:hypothetical protein
LIALALGFIGLPAVAHAANNCPWINEATASGLLGSEAVGTFIDATPRQPATCIFTQQAAEVTRTLRITVELMSDPHQILELIAAHCATAGTPLPAIGNEAMVCSAEGHNGAPAEFVAGRVRDQVFTITIHSTLKGDSILTRDALKVRIVTAAEQISGNLF